MTAPPRVTVGLPVFNGAATIASTLAALRAQTYRDLELVVSDNASTDATREIVQRVAQEDSRVRYVRQIANIGANANYSFVARMARGEFLKWASASDWVAPTFIERCVEALDANPDAVLASPRTRLFQDDPSMSTPYEFDLSLTDDDQLRRLREWFRLVRWNNSFNGVIRMDALRRTALVEAYMGSDNVLMGHLALLGKFVLVDEPLYFRRMDAATTTSKRDRTEQIRHHYPTAGARALFQTWKRHAGWFRAAAAVPMPIGRRIRLYSYLAHRGYWEAGALMRDVGAAVEYAFGRR